MLDGRLRLRVIRSKSIFVAQDRIGAIQHALGFGVFVLRDQDRGESVEECTAIRAVGAERTIHVRDRGARMPLRGVQFTGVAQQLGEVGFGEHRGAAVFPVQFLRVRKRLFQVGSRFREPSRLLADRACEDHGGCQRAGMIRAEHLLDLDKCRLQQRLRFGVARLFHVVFREARGRGEQAGTRRGRLRAMACDDFLEQGFRGRVVGEATVGDGEAVHAFQGVRVGVAEYASLRREHARIAVEAGLELAGVAFERGRRALGEHSLPRVGRQAGSQRERLPGEFGRSGNVAEVAGRARLAQQHAHAIRRRRRGVERGAVVFDRELVFADAVVAFRDCLLDRHANRRLAFELAAGAFRGRVEDQAQEAAIHAACEVGVDASEHRLHEAGDLLGLGRFHTSLLGRCERDIALGCEPMFGEQRLHEQGDAGDDHQGSRGQRPRVATCEREHAFAPRHLHAGRRTPLEQCVEIGVQRVYGRVALCGIGIEAAREHAAEVPAQATHELLRIAVAACREIGAAFGIELPETQARHGRRRSRKRPRTAVPRQYADTQLVQDEADTVNVARGADRLAGKLFGTRIVRRERARRGCAYRGVGLDQARDAEIEQLRQSVRRDQHVAGLQVAMHDQRAVRVRERGEQSTHEAQARRNAEARLVAVFEQRHAVDVFHDQERASVVGRAGIDQGRDVRVMQAREDAPFLGEAIECGTFQPAPAQELERDQLLEVAHLAFGEIHRAHAALAEHAQQAETAEFAIEPGGWVEIQAAPERIDRTAERIGALRIEREQALDARGDLRFARAQRIEPCATRVRIEIERLVEQDLDARRGIVHGAAMRSASHARANRSSRSTVALEMPIAAPISS